MWPDASVCFLSLVPGSGKTYASIRHALRAAGRRLGVEWWSAAAQAAVLFVAPANIRVCEGCTTTIDGHAIRLRGMTAHKFLGLMVSPLAGDASAMRSKTPPDITGIVAVVFDEVFQVPLTLMARLRQHMDELTGLILVCNGDPHQLNQDNGVCGNNVRDRAAYVEEALAAVIPMCTHLTEMRRMTCPKERARMTAILAELQAGAHPPSVVRKHFPRAQFLRTEAAVHAAGVRAGVAGTHRSAWGFGRMMGEGEPGVGSMMRVFKHDRRTGGLHVGEVVTVTEMERREDMLWYRVLSAADEDLWLPATTLTPACAATAWGAQGATYDDPYMVTDWPETLDYRFLVVAMTRGRTMSQLYFWDGPGMQGKWDIAKKITGYKAQDAAAGRDPADAETLSVPHVNRLLKAAGFKCAWCGDGIAPDTLTLDRTDAAMAVNRGHHIDHVVVACCHCNVSRSNRGGPPALP